MPASKKKAPAKKTVPLSARERIVLTASRLFYQDGVRATGIDKIIAESEVAKMSFYRHFPSKNDLVAEYLQRRHESWMKWFVGATEQRLAQPGAGLEVIAEVLREWFEEPNFRGCAFINTQAETPAAEERLNGVIRDHKAALQTYIAELAHRLALEAPLQTAAHAMVVIEGSIVRVQMTGDLTVCDSCSHLLRKLGRTARRSDTASADPDLAPYFPGF